MNFDEIASVSGKGGLFKVLKPTRTGAILESLDKDKKRMVVGMNSKVSVLSEISIYTTDEEGAVPLINVLKNIHKEFDGDTGLTKTSEPDELKSFLKFVLPNYDEDRVYVSDIKKIINWYDQLLKIDKKIFNEDEKKEAGKEDKKEEPGKTKKESHPESKEVDKKE